MSMKPIIAALLFYFSAMAAAYGCSCVPLPPQERRDHSSTVFIGQVAALREQGSVRHYEFQVGEILKGAPAERLVVSSSGSSAACGSSFEQGISYLIYADGATGHLTTHLCKGNCDAASSDGKAEIEALRGRK